MPSTLSPNMGLIVPGVGTEPGPTWATDLNSSLGILDQHDHSSGSGVKVTPDGININIDLPMNGNNLTQVNTVNFNNLLSALPGLSPNLGCIYVAGGEFYYNDEVGNVVQVTNGGSVNAGAGSITGLPSGTASASYSAGGQKFIWQSATSTAAGMDGGPVTIREILSGANGVTLASPNALAANYSLVFPAALPGVQNFMTLDSSGNIAAVWNVDNSTIEVASNNLQLKNSGVTPIKMAPRTSSGSTAAIGEIGVATSSAAFSTSSNSPILVTNQDVTITTVGRPVCLMVCPDGSTNDTYIGMTTSVVNTDISGEFLFYRDGSEISRTSIYAKTNGVGTFRIPCSSLSFLDVIVAGTYDYQLQVAVAIGFSIEVSYVQMKVYEI